MSLQTSNVRINADFPCRAKTLHERLHFLIGYLALLQESGLCNTLLDEAIGDAEIIRQYLEGK